MGNQGSSHDVEHVVLKSQLHKPVVLTSDSFIEKEPLFLRMQDGHTFVDRNGKVQFRLRHAPDSSVWCHHVECVDGQGYVVANQKSGVVYSGKHCDEVTATFKTHSITGTTHVHLRGGNHLVVHVRGPRAALFMDDGGHQSCIGVCQVRQRWSVTLSPGVDVTLGVFVLKWLRDILYSYWGHGRQYESGSVNVRLIVA
ncbi:Aste57867_17606 [Aphanomyces stellatus]|uniref:Aste57867_17606 protein n=1 Tax=Aphanomyces stellatus TaxID=120398 RepID=A0A485L904_9STRA|nr:hypothetical protein As57867_017546 [Aphanomyces stellatus]VFT94357.1 Aste57867_17606 [Aphanomyces stellatus]